MAAGGRRGRARDRRGGDSRKHRVAQAQSRRRAGRALGSRTWQRRTTTAPARGHSRTRAVPPAGTRSAGGRFATTSSSARRRRGRARPRLRGRTPTRTDRARPGTADVRRGPIRSGGTGARPPIAPGSRGRGWLRRAPARGIRWRGRSKVARSGSAAAGRARQRDGHGSGAGGWTRYWCGAAAGFMGGSPSRGPRTLASR